MGTEVFSRPPAKAYRPATFQERGVAVPYTTPVLAGARARLAERGGIELIVPNPSGGSGIYVMPCTSLRSLCRITVHDSRLTDRLATVRILTPATVRQVALTVAVEGLAGRAAMEAAERAIEQDQRDTELTRYLLVVTLADRLAPAEFADADWRHEPRRPDLEQRAQAIAMRSAAALGRSPADLLAVIDALTEVFSPTGLAGQSPAARVPRLIASLAVLRGDLATWIKERPCDTHLELADTIVESASRGIAAAEAALTTAHAMARDIAALLSAWRRSPEKVADIVDRSEWLIDGWPQICQLWRASGGPDERCAAMAEMALLVPTLPREVDERGSATGASRQSISFDKDWRSGAAAAGLTARNERLRALAF